MPERDIIERLRDIVREEIPASSAETARDAIAEIERLRAELESIRKDIDDADIEADFEF